MALHALAPQLCLVKGSLKRFSAAAVEIISYISGNTIFNSSVCYGT